MQLRDIVSPDILFRDYVYVSSTSRSFVEHFESYAADVAKDFDVKNKLVIDLGSNDGVLLKPFKSLGAKVLGIDPAIEIARKATQEGIETLPEFFTPDLAKDIVAKRGNAKIISANNVFAHIDDVKAVLEGADILLSGDGVFVAEFPYLVDFINKGLFDTVYHEHLSYYGVRQYFPIPK